MRQLLGIRRIYGVFLLVVITCFCVLSCTKESTADTPPQGESVGLQLNIETLTDIVTSRSNASTEELAIKRGSLYVFDEHGGCYGHEYIVLSSITNLGSKTPHIYAEILNDPKLPKKNKVVVIINHKEVELPNPTDVTYSTIEEYFSITGSGGEAEPAGFYDISTGLPMYGEMDNWSKSSKKMDVRRSVAKLMVQINGVPTGIFGASFTTANVTYGIFNNAISGFIKDNGNGGMNHSNSNNNPFSGFLGDNEHNSRIGKKTVAFPTAQAAADAVSYLYEYPYATRVVGKAATSDISSTPTTYKKERLAIVLKVNSSTPRYYRLDLARQTTVDGVATYLNVERNHQYRVIIRAVHDGGYATATEAILGIPSNIDFSIEDDKGIVTIGNGNKYAISIEEEGPKFTRVAMGASSDVKLNFSTGVRYILNSSLPNLPSEAVATNKIDIYNVDLVTGFGTLRSTIAPALTPSSTSLDFELTGSSISKRKKLKYKVTLGTLVYTSEVFSVEWHDGAYGVNVKVGDDPEKWITVADKNCGVTYNLDSPINSSDAKHVKWYGHYYTGAGSGAGSAIEACNNFRCDGGTDDWRLPTEEEFRIMVGTLTTSAQSYIEVSTSSLGADNVMDAGIDRVFLQFAGVNDSGASQTAGRAQGTEAWYRYKTDSKVGVISIQTTGNIGVNDFPTMGFSVRCVRDVPS